MIRAINTFSLSGDREIAESTLNAAVVAGFDAIGERRPATAGIWGRRNSK